MDTIERLQRLGKVYHEGGASPFIDQAIEKIFAHEQAEAKQRLAQLKTDLAEYEARFGMDSATFFARYERGEMGDDADVFEWAALYRMFLRAEERLQLLNRPAA
jgi:hypothetical protein